LKVSRLSTTLEAGRRARPSSELRILLNSLVTDETGQSPSRGEALGDFCSGRFGAKRAEKAPERCELLPHAGKTSGGSRELAGLLLAAPVVELGSERPDRPFEAGTLGVELERPRITVRERFLEAGLARMVAAFEAGKERFEAVSDRCELV
jgi:hypothetical protein